MLDTLLEQNKDSFTNNNYHAVKKAQDKIAQIKAKKEQDVAKMVEYAHQALYQADYVPYYMYRQKYMMENLENVGFCKKGKPCLYNIGIMEEITDILACGSGAISKKLTIGQNKIERSANAKDVITYIDRCQDYIDKKFQLFAPKN